MFKLYFYSAFFTYVCIIVFANQCYYGGVLGPTGNNYFSVNNNPTLWNTAESICYKQLGHLASSDHAFDNSFLITLSIEAPEFWLGGIINYRGVWSWTNSNNFSYTNWDKANGEPRSNQSGTCIAINKATGLWRAAKCTEEKPFVCEMPKIRQWDAGKCDSSGGIEWQYSSNINKCYYETGLLQNTSYGQLIAACNGLTNDNSSTPLIIHSSDEMAVVQGMIDSDMGNNTYGCSKRYMLGLQDPYNNGSYIWADGSKVNYTGWNNQTNPPPGVCFFAFTLGQLWIPSECNVFGVPINIICQYSPK